MNDNIKPCPCCGYTASGKENRRTTMDRDKLKAMLKHCEDYNSKYDGKPLDINKLADYLIANGIGDVTAEKHRADRAEEALDLAYEEWTCCDSCMFSVDCKTNRTDCKKAEISKIKQKAEEYGKEVE